MSVWLSENGMFYLLTILSAFFAVICVNTRLILRSAVYLMAVLFFVAGIYLTLGLDFLAGIQILVYVGGIVVVLVFAVMLTHSHSVAEKNPHVFRKLLGFLTAATFFLGSWWAVANTPALSAKTSELLPRTVDLKTIGRALLDFGASGYVLPFELVSLLLLAVLIGGVVIARKDVG